MATLFNAIFDILSFSSFIILVVLGLGIIASMMGVFNFAHGEFVLLGAYHVYLFSVWGLPIWLGMLTAPIVVALVGLFLERTIVHRFYIAPVAGMLMLYAIGIIIRESVRDLTGGLYYSVPKPVSGAWHFGDVTIARWGTVVILVTALVVIGSRMLIRKTTWGLKMRAALENPELARVSGISTTKLYALTFSFGAALAGLAGALMVPQFSLFADLGVRFLIWGFLAVMLGGFGTFEGPVLGAAVIGSMTSGFPWIMNPYVGDILVFVLAVVIVRIKPMGLFSNKRS